MFKDFFISRYVQLPGDEVDTHLLQDATRKEAAQSKQWPLTQVILKQNILDLIPVKIKLKPSKS